MHKLALIGVTIAALAVTSFGDTGPRQHPPNGTKKGQAVQHDRNNAQRKERRFNGVFHFGRD